MEARGDPHLARGTSGVMEKEVTEIQVERGGITNGLCKVGSCSGHQKTAQKTTELVMRRAGTRTQEVDCSLDPREDWCTVEAKKVAGIHTVHKVSELPRGPCPPPYLQGWHPTSGPQELIRMEDGTKGSREHDEKSHAEAGSNINGSYSGEGTQTGTNKEGAGGLRGCLVNGRKRGGCGEAEDHGCMDGRERHLGALCGGQDGHQPTIHGKYSEDVTRGNGIPGGEKERGQRNTMALSPGTGSPAEGCYEEGRSPSRAEIHQARSSAAIGKQGHDGRAPHALQPTQKYTDTTQISGLRVAVGGGGGQGGGSGGSGGGKRRGQGAPRFWIKRFADPPSGEDLQQAWPEWEEGQRKNLPLNVKSVPPGNLAEVRKLEAEDRACTTFFEEAIRILHDEQFYLDAIKDSGLEPSPLRKTSLSAKELDMMLGGKLEGAAKNPVWGVFGFKVAEPAKGRCRAIFDCDLNLVFKTTLAYCLKNKDQIRSCCHNGGDDEFVFLQFDFKSFYDQFVLWLRVRRFFGLLGHDEMVYWLRLLPMGFRLAVAAAQATMWMFLNFPKSEKVNVATCIDNVCFSGKRSLVHPVVNTFLERVFSCGFTLNGWDGSKYLLLNLSERMSKLRETEEREFDFLGETYSLSRGVRAMTTKTVDKLVMVWQAIGKLGFQVTNRQFFCLIGLLVYATGVLSIPTYKYFNVFRKVRLLSAKLNENESLWDSPLSMSLSKGEVVDLTGWVKAALRNEPVPTLSGRKEPPPLDQIDAMYIVVDASEWGWGALLFNNKRVCVGTGCGKWGKGDFSSSVKAEPLGVRQAVLHFRHSIRSCKVAILTDHESLVWASRSMFTHSFFYNSCFVFLQGMKKELNSNFFFYFLAGVRNTADSLSRGTGVETRSFPLVAGSGVSGRVCASSRPWQL